MAEHRDIDGSLSIEFKSRPKITIVDRPASKIVFSKGNDFKDGHEIRRSARERVTEHRLGNRTIKFHQQLNGYDCGPCLVLNVFEIFKNKSGFVENIRQQINSCNENGFQSSDKGLLHDVAVERFLYNEGFIVDRYRFIDNQNFKKKIDDSFEKKSKIFTFSGSNGHFSGFYLDETSSVWQLDSLREGPIPSSISEMRCFLDNLGRNNPLARASVIQNRNNT